MEKKMENDMETGMLLGTSRQPNSSAAPHRFTACCHYRYYSCYCGDYYYHCYYHYVSFLISTKYFNFHSPRLRLPSSLHTSLH